MWHLRGGEVSRGRSDPVARGESRRGQAGSADQGGLGRASAAPVAGTSDDRAPWLTEALAEVEALHVRAMLEWGLGQAPMRRAVNYRARRTIYLLGFIATGRLSWAAAMYADGRRRDSARRLPTDASPAASCGSSPPWSATRSPTTETATSPRSKPRASLGPNRGDLPRRGDGKASPSQRPTDRSGGAVKAIPARADRTGERPALTATKRRSFLRSRARHRRPRDPVH